MYKVILLPIARKDLREIVKYINDVLKAPQAASDFAAAFKKSALGLQDFPHSHPLFYPERRLDTDYRMMAVKNYTVFYTVMEDNETVDIHRILYSKRDFERLL